jgi:arabinose-5-phosphate isomerase
MRRAESLVDAENNDRSHGVTQPAVRNGQSSPSQEPRGARPPAVAPLPGPRPNRAAGTLEHGRAVLEVEAAALATMADHLDGAFVAAVELIQGLEGRVVCTGMGKSGHIARKIAATLSSTGTPAMFVHPGEASHGDLGMITGKDAVLALSNSGETAELKDLILYTRRFAIPLIAMIGKADSTLGRESEVALVLPQITEACPMGLAPTTSTTAMLALGDALAVALLESAGFTPQHFAVFHPGGKLGSQLLRVDQLMRGVADLPLVPPDCPMSEALLVMTEKCLGCVGVIRGDGRLEGIVTDGDIRRRMGTDLLARTAEEVMTPSPRTIAPDLLAVEALATMNRHSITVLFVVEDGVPVGAVHLHDCLRAGIA